MIPQKTDPRWLKLIKGEPKRDFKSVPLGLMLSRLGREYAGNGSPSVGQGCVDELHAFFTKYEGILGEDIAAIFG